MADDPLDLDALERNDDAAAGGGADDPPKPRRQPLPRRKRDRSNDQRRRHDQSSLKVRLQESIESVAGWISERGDDELGEILERDAAKMAGVLEKVAKTNPAAKKAVGVIADLLEPVRAFGPTLRVLYSRLMFRREQRRAEAEWEAEQTSDEVTPPVAVAGPGPVEPDEPEIAEPWRLPG